jgi:hypothetical protein
MGLRLSKITKSTSKKEPPPEDFYDRSSDVIDDIVDRYLHNEFTNNPLVPDFIERRMYRNVVKLMIGIMKDTLETSNVDVLGHRITFSLDTLEKPRPTL